MGKYKSRKMTLVRRKSRTVRVPENTMNFCRHRSIGKGVEFSFVKEKWD